MSARRQTPWNLLHRWCALLEAMHLLCIATGKVVPGLCFGCKGDMLVMRVPESHAVIGVGAFCV